VSTACTAHMSICHIYGCMYVYVCVCREREVRLLLAILKQLLWEARGHQRAPSLPPWPPPPNVYRGYNQLSINFLVDNLRPLILLQGSCSFSHMIILCMRAPADTTSTLPLWSHKRGWRLTGICVLASTHPSRSMEPPCQMADVLLSTTLLTATRRHAKA
jgi:hypothetical protein